MTSGSQAESKWLNLGEQVAKFLMTLLTFSVVLGTAVISKGTLLFITSQIDPNLQREFCNDTLGKSHRFVVTLPNVERVAWIWILIFIYWVPQLAIFMRSIRICLFKTWQWPPFWDFLSLFVTETFPTIGSALLVFAVLPEMDVVKGAMLTNAVCFVPGFVGKY